MNGLLFYFIKCIKTLKIYAGQKATKSSDYVPFLRLDVVGSNPIAFAQKSFFYVVL